MIIQGATVSSARVSSPTERFFYKESVTYSRADVPNLLIQRATKSISDGLLESLFGNPHGVRHEREREVLGW